MRAFSLAELSIVLVILGLLTGGILAGQSLIRAAELRNFTAQINRYTSATYSFRDRYMALPGDMRNATAFWGAADGSTGLTTACLNATASGTCNGDASGALSMISNSHERFRYWQQLTLAGLIEGSYSGVTGPLSAGDVVREGNVPGTRLSSTSVITAQSPGTISNTHTWMFPGNYGAIAFMLGEDTNDGNFDGDTATLIAEDAWNIDAKQDDGKPGTGRITTYLHSRRANCASSDDPATAIYLLTSTTKSCVLIIPSGI